MPLMKDYLQSMIPQTTTPPPELDLMAWSLDLFDDSKSGRGPEYDSWFEKVWSLPIKGCSQMVCKKIEWEGDPDVSGVGVRPVWMSQVLLSQC